MLRALFGESPRIAEGRLKETLLSMERFITLTQNQMTAGRDEGRLRKAEIWTLGLLVSLDELEQSQYAAKRYAGQIENTLMSQMSETEILSYSRHIYYDKNAFIRVFAILDKLGILMNELFELQTERMKPHFSYFTVLRNMRGRKIHLELAAALNEIKERNQEPMARLRKRRNTEIHYMNSELQDDLKRVNDRNAKDARLENIEAQLEDLEKGCEMVIDTLKLTFDYAYRKMRKVR